MSIGTYLEDREDQEIKKLTPKVARSMIEDAISEAGWLAETSGNSGHRIVYPRSRMLLLKERVELMKIVARANWKTALRNAQH